MAKKKAKKKAAKTAKKATKKTAAKKVAKKAAKSVAKKAAKRTAAPKSKKKAATKNTAKKAALLAKLSRFSYPKMFAKDLDRALGSASVVLPDLQAAQEQNLSALFTSRSQRRREASILKSFFLGIGLKYKAERLIKHWIFSGLSC